MRWLVWLLLLSCAAVAVALVARFSNGNVAILWPPYRVDLSVNLALTIIALSFLFLHLFLVGISKAFALSQKVRDYREGRAREKAHEALSASLLAWFEGRYGRSERLAKEAQSDPQTSNIAALVGARAAHRMREYQRRDQWLAQANDPAAKAAKLLTQAELLVEEQKGTEALVAIAEAQKTGARHIQSLRIALRAHEQVGDWAQVIKLTNTLDKRDALHPAISQQHRVGAYRKLLQVAEGPALAKSWADIKGQADIRARLAGVVALRLEEQGATNAAKTIYLDELNETFNASFLRRYLALQELSLTERLQQVEMLRKKYGDEPELLAAMGDLCTREKLWGKAQSFLEQSIAKRPSVAAHHSLAVLFETTDRTELAQQHFRHAANLALAESSLSRPE
jgi:HemY protein